jgi:hypothetical protein
LSFPCVYWMNCFPSKNLIISRPSWTLSLFPHHPYQGICVDVSVHISSPNNNWWFGPSDSLLRIDRWTLQSSFPQTNNNNLDGKSYAASNSSRPANISRQPGQYSIQTTTDCFTCNGTFEREI